MERHSHTTGAALEVSLPLRAVSDHHVNSSRVAAVSGKMTERS
jgi:hypothetical protein